MIMIESVRNGVTVQLKYPDALIVDVSYSSFINGYWSGVFNPFYPHGNIRVLYTDGYTGISVSAIWNSLKVFEMENINEELRNSIDIQSLKRRYLGRLIGFRQGYHNNYIMDVTEAREKIYIPMYRWMLEHKVLPIIQKLREISQQRDIVLLDDSVNCDINNISQPLSHAWLIKSNVEGLYPYKDVYVIKNTTNEVIVGQHMYHAIKEVRCLKEIKPDSIDRQLRLGFDNNC